MNPLYSHAKTELDILCKTSPDNFIKEFTPEILAIVKKFGKSGQSGGSAPIVATGIAETIKDLFMLQPICPVTGHDDEWFEFTRGEYQNVRCSSLFKKGKKGRAYYLDAVKWKTPSGQCWTGTALDHNGNEMYSRQYVRFPFTPKSFYIDVSEKEIKKDFWEFTIKNMAQFEKVFKYYDKYTGS